MQFALFTHVPWPEGTDLPQIMAQTTAQIQYAEALGFHGAWLAEHHFTRYSMVSSSLVLASFIAARTTTIRVGTAVVVSPLHNPIQVAEDTAMADLLSGGRLDVGFGRGTMGYEYSGYNIDPTESQERFQDSLNIVQGLWTTPDFSYPSKYYHIHRLNLVPPPVQKPHPPIYIAATRTSATLAFAIAQGYNLCIAVVQDTAEALALCQRFVTQARAAGQERSMADIPFFRYCYVGETPEQVQRDTAGKLDWVADIMQWRRFIKEGSEVYQNMDTWRRTRTELPQDHTYLAQHRAVLGTPEQCIAQIKALRAQGIEHFGCNFDFGGMEPEKVQRSMTLFATEVMPALR